MFTTLFLFAVRYHQTANKKFSSSNCKWKIIQCKWELSHANENYRMQMKIIACKWKLSNANENYRMEMKIIQYKWKKISHANENYPMQMKNYRMQMKNYPMQMNKIEYCNVSHAIQYFYWAFWYVYLTLPHLKYLRFPKRDPIIRATNIGE